MKHFFNDNPIYVMVFRNGCVVLEPDERRIRIQDIHDAELIITRDLLRPDVYHVVKDRLEGEGDLDRDEVDDAVVDTVARVKNYVEPV